MFFMIICLPRIWSCFSHSLVYVVWSLRVWNAVLCVFGTIDGFLYFWVMWFCWVIGCSNVNAVVLFTGFLWNVLWLLLWGVVLISYMYIKRKGYCGCSWKLFLSGNWDYFCILKRAWWVTYVYILMIDVLWSWLSIQR